ncbi:MAG: isoprenyl transferase [Alphaproteobacteria bacterium]|nr:isoprenyl transferase [Alphaproteobacteria bacterium]
MDQELKIPKHIAIIMDGNGRWAKNRGLPRTVGHTNGAKALQRTIEACKKFGIKTLTVYGFSTENWSRPKEEVDFLMNLFFKYLTNQSKKLIENKIRFIVLGDKSRFTPEIQNAMKKLESETKDFTEFTFNVALNYGGHAEIVKASKEIAMDVKAGKISADDIDEKLFESYLYTAGQLPPDLIIRTSGEQRLSGFLLWQCSYSEFYFPKVHFPDFNEEQLKLAIQEYTKRDRRYGKV